MPSGGKSFGRACGIGRKSAMDFELPGEGHPEHEVVRAWLEANPARQLIIDGEMKRAGIAPIARA